jgi:hypothetical protein
LIFVNKNWLIDFRIECKSPSNLIIFLKRDLNLERELEEFEVDFKKDEVVEV